MRKTFSIILMFIGISFCLAQNGVINGKIVAEIPEEAELIAENTKVILEINGIEKTTVVDKNLNFSFHNLESDSIRIRTEPHSYMRQLTIIGFLKPNETVEIKIPYSLSCKYDQSKENKTCPICKKQDQVIPISYGLIAEITKKGEEKKDKVYKSGGCVTTGCDPNWYCKRDEINF
ncbi:hypothetical protein ACFQ3R_14715 [Mesonia ostreae]|uniref:Uncharacterized protein n=1 Tax=Mesonia ostreae TaxID=861110 RepID=A0ABU2KMG5_9FLAO|nr:hypothetical protein [Mesonia ostreae]MDT0295920.1 hypothetical protein [Mesonia ostreae]